MNLENKESRPQKSVVIDSFECPFCRIKDDVIVEAKTIDGAYEEGIGFDYWECTHCGAENDIFSKDIVKDFEPLFPFTQKEDWQGLLDYCKKTDDVFVFLYAKHLVQKKEFEQAIKVLQVLVQFNKNDYPSSSLLEFLEKHVFFLELKKGLKKLDIGQIAYALEDHSGSHWFLDKKNGDCIFVSAFELDSEKELQKMRSKPERFLEISPIPSFEVKNMMKEFSEIRPDEEFAEKLFVALNGKGAFREFKDSVVSEDSQREWLAFHGRFFWDKALDWICGNFRGKENGQKET